MAPRDTLTFVCVRVCVCVCVCVCVYVCVHVRSVQLDHADSMGTTVFLFLAAIQQSFDLFCAMVVPPLPTHNTHTHTHRNQRKKSWTL